MISLKRNRIIGLTQCAEAALRAPTSSRDRRAPPTSDTRCWICWRRTESHGLNQFTPGRREQSNFHMSTFVRVIIDRSIRRELDYSVPETLTDKVVVGSRVRVPFRDKSLLATVVATLDESPAEGIKPIRHC